MMPSFGRPRNELVFTHSVAFSPIYDVHRSRNEAVHFASTEENIRNSFKYTFLRTQRNEWAYIQALKLCSKENTCLVFVLGMLKMHFIEIKPKCFFHFFLFLLHLFFCVNL